MSDCGEQPAIDFFEFKSMSRGGARPGAGRKPRAVRNGTAIQQAEQLIKDRLPDIIGKMVALTEDPDKGVRLKACIYLTDRVWGKPTQAVEMSGEAGEAIRIRVEYADADLNDHAAETP
jgi:hypothetical protein